MYRFIMQYPGEAGWVIKMPFATNREFVKYSRTVEGIVRILYLAELFMLWYNPAYATKRSIRLLYRMA